MQKKFFLPIVSLLVGIGIGFIGGMEYKAYQVRTAISSALDGSSKTEEQSIVKEAEESKAQIIEKKVGEEVVLATLSFKINKVEEKQTLTGGYDAPKVAKEGTKFVLITLNITNTTDTKFTFFPDDGSRLVDNKDREFTTYSDTIGGVANYLNVRDLQPSVPENGVIVYEVPNDSESYSFMIGKAGTNETYKIIEVRRKSR